MDRVFDHDGVWYHVVLEYHRKTEDFTENKYLRKAHDAIKDEHEGNERRVHIARCECLELLRKMSAVGQG